MTSTFVVTRSDGRKEVLDLNKIHKVLTWSSDDHRAFILAATPCQYVTIPINSNIGVTTPEDRHLEYWPDIDWSTPKSLLQSTGRGNHSPPPEPPIQQFPPTFQSPHRQPTTAMTATCNSHAGCSLKSLYLV